jgi:prepilin-type N-terminal cleavage/methylation domain-containing protein
MRINKTKETQATKRALPGARGAFSASRPNGFTMLEVLVTVGLTAMLLAIFSASIVGTVFIAKSSTSIQAHEFIQEEIDTLRSLQYIDLLDRTDGNWLGVPFNRGGWSVQSKDVGAYSGGQVLELDSSATALYDETGLITLPGNYREDFTFSAAVNVQDASPSGWSAGIAFRYRDAENHYRLRFTSGGMTLERVHQGTIATLDTDSYAFVGDGTTWHVIEVVVTGNSITAKRDGITAITATDDYFTVGDLALMTGGDALAWFDDVSVTEDAVTDTWYFDDTSHLGDLPVDWKRMSCLDLIEGACDLTIEDYYGEEGIKQVTVNVYWNESGKIKNATGQTLIAE